MSYSIWMVPKELEVRESLANLVKDLASANGGPEFEPHMTLLGDLDRSLEEMKKICEELAVDVKPFRVETGSIEYSTTYYQCVFVRIRPTPELMELYDRMKGQMGMLNPSVFMPHISLMYGNVSYSKREEIVSELKFKPKQFTFDSLVVTPGGENPPSEWKHLFEVKFSLSE